MNKKNQSGKVIEFRKRTKAGNDNQPPLKSDTYEIASRVIAITSGKGGVGKTNIVANLGYSLEKIGKKVLIMDADMGLGNMDVLLGLTPEYNLSHFLFNNVPLEDIIIDGPGSLKILPASSGLEELTHITNKQRTHLFEKLFEILNGIDILLIDTAAGISSNVLQFNLKAHDIIVVVTPEPTSMTDAYALIKILALKYDKNKFNLLINQVNDSKKAYEIYRQIKMVVDRFLSIDLEYSGHVLFDQKMMKAVKEQRILCDLFPNSYASKCFNKLAGDIGGSIKAKRCTDNKNIYSKRFRDFIFI